MAHARQSARVSTLGAQADHLLKVVNIYCFLKINEVLIPPNAKLLHIT